MDNLRTVIKMLFRQISPQEVLNGKADYDRIGEERFLRLSNVYLPQYSNDEIKNMIQYLEHEFEWQHNRLRGEEHSRHYDGINVFDAVFVFVQSVLIEESGMPLCGYEHLLRWRDMTLELDEDLMVTSFLAFRDLSKPNIRRNFFWPPVIGHNNFMLNRILERGVAENHFHLKGSAPLFHLSWISMMNDVTNPVFYKALREYDRRRLNQNISQSALDPHAPLEMEYPRAALIRLFLFCEMQNWTCRFFEEEKKRRKPDNLSAFQIVMDLLCNPDRLLFFMEDIQDSIEQLKQDSQTLDYAICESWLKVNPDRRLNEVIPGERYFLYRMFQKIYQRNERFLHYANLFYIYIIIKANIRTEMIQSNRNVGFDNFRLYQDRKEQFIENTPFHPIYHKIAVRDTILNQHIVKLEARITPRESASDNADYIRKIDRWITAEEKSRDEKEALLKKYFYVFHFIKQPDPQQDKYLIGAMRHEDLRETVKRQALAIAEFRSNEQYEEVAGRLKGIDACSPEIDCRPEVFAQAFRFLKEQNIYESGSVFRHFQKLPDLKATYHVGEDNYDIVDGMRAIDEAISFLNLRCGDRLGHALALGVDVREWYEGRAQRILIPQINYLDNLAWLYAKIREFHLTDCMDALSYIEKRYDEYFRLIYLNNISSDWVEEIVRQASEFFDKKEIRNNYRNHQFQFSIDTYYDSWKLRGDDPTYYKYGYFRLNDISYGDPWDQYGVNKIFPNNYRLRYNPEAAFLYYLYHFSAEVKMEGAKTLEIKVNPYIINAAERVQESMQKMICDRGIAIETNPSSNYLIGSFKRYDKHPIIKWFNHGLTYDYEKLMKCPQIQVSINTDDQGVFVTSLENEYAVLSLALEKARNADGTHKYNRTMICHWLDHIREMGISQSFS